MMPTLFFDEGVIGAGRLVGLKHIEITIEYPGSPSSNIIKGTSDHEWLLTISKRGWIIFTIDRGIYRDRSLLNKLAKYGIRMIFLEDVQHLKKKEIADIIERTWSYIFINLLFHDGPWINKISHRRSSVPGKKPKVINTLEYL